jgi:serine/threonine-protein kinase RsbT
VARETLDIDIELLQVCPLRTEEDLVNARQAIKLHAVDLGFSTMNQTKIITAASELGRNVLEHGKGGDVHVERLRSLEKVGLRMTFKDSGPGIENLELALTDGYTSKKGLGLGLTGSKRLMDEFELTSSQGQGTTVSVTKWT